MVLLRLIHHIRRNVLIADVLAQIVVVNLGAHGHQVDDTLEGILSADRQLDRDCIALEAILHHLDNIEEIRAHDVHLVDERHTRDMIVVRLMPNGLRLRLYAALCAEYGHRTIKDTQGALNLNGEVHVARGVDDVDTMFRVLLTGTGPVAGGRRGGDGDTTLLLLRHPVHGGGAVMGVADLVVYTGVIQNTLGSRGLAGIDVRHDADISGSLQRIFSRHICSPFRTARSLITVVSECLIRLCHLVRVLTLLDRAAQIVSCIEDLASQACAHGLLGAGAGILGDPAQAQSLTALRTNFHRHLVGGAADTACLYLQARHDVLHSLSENLQGFTTGFVSNNVKSTINDLLRNALLAVQHDRIDQLGNQLGIVERIGQNVSLGNISSSWHFTSLLH